LEALNYTVAPLRCTRKPGKIEASNLPSKPRKQVKSSADSDSSKESLPSKKEQESLQTVVAAKGLDTHKISAAQTPLKDLTGNIGTPLSLIRP